MKYYILNQESPEDAEGFKSHWEWASDCNEYIAQDAAEHFYRDGDGWETEWPVEIAILSDDGKELGRFEVEQKLVPTFSATEI